jgi:CRISPR system Cascade subunit CasE
MSTEVIMYLSKVLVGKHGRFDPYEVHLTLWRLFPEEPAAKRDFLFRVGESDYSGTVVLMQSNRQPEAPSGSATRILACKEYRPVLTRGQRLQFLVVANPIKMINDENDRKDTHGETKKCRVPLIREEEQRAWVERKLHEAAQIETVVLDHGSPLQFRKAKEDRTGKIQTVTFKGILQVQDIGIMARVLETGIGPAKAFGCGMISLARA